MIARLVTLLLCLASGLVHAQDLLMDRLPFGEHAVGFRLVRDVDAGRSYLPARDVFGKPTHFPRGRPMQVAIWYPAVTGGRGQALRFGDYLRFSASDEDFGKTSAADREAEVTAFLGGFDGDVGKAMRQLLKEPTRAWLDAPPAPGDWPVVLYAPPLDSGYFDNSVLCEYLASKGFLVLSVTAKGEYSRLQSPTVRSLEVQVDDLAFLKQLARRYSASDRIGTIGFSRGGLANLLFAIKNKDVSATVSLDGSVFSEGWLKDVAASPYFVPAQLQSDLLMITKNLREPQLNPATFYEAAIHADRTLVRFDHDGHAYFSSWGLLQETAPATASMKAIPAFYAEMAGYVGEFLDASLKDGPALQAHADQRFRHAYASAPAKKSLEPADVGFWIAAEGMDYVNRAIEAIVLDDPDYLQQLSWRELTAAADRASGAGRREEALKILLLADRVAPGWYVVNEKIATAYQEAGQLDQAQRYFARALHDNPRSQAARRALTSLGAAPPDASPSVSAAWYPRYLGSYGKGDRGEKVIFLQDGALYIRAATWDAPARLLAFEPGRFIVESDDPKANLQLLFELGDDGHAVGLRTRGMNSGKVGELQRRSPAP